MSTFEEALIAYTKGKSIRRPVWDYKFYSHELKRDREVKRYVCFSSDDITATDWVIE